MSEYTVEQALEALDSMDDFARMDIGVDAVGPRTVLESFIKQVAERSHSERKQTRSRLPDGVQTVTNAATGESVGLASAEAQPVAWVKMYDGKIEIDDNCITSNESYAPDPIDGEDDPEFSFAPVYLHPPKAEAPALQPLDVEAVARIIADGMGIDTRTIADIAETICAKFAAPAGEVVAYRLISDEGGFITKQTLDGIKLSQKYYGGKVHKLIDGGPV